MLLRTVPPGLHSIVCALAFVVALAAPVPAQTPALSPDTYTYGVEWRFVRAGEVRIQWTPDHQVKLALRSTGLVANLFKVDNRYVSSFDAGLCATSSLLELHEGRRNREVKVTFDKNRKRASFFEKDLNTGATLLSKEIDVPACVYDVPGGLLRLRQLRPEPGSLIEVPASDGKKVVMAKIEAQAKEIVRTPLGQYNCIRYEAFLFNGVLYSRKGRLFVWLTDDEKRIPVQVKVQLPFYVGTITLQVEKIQ